MLFAIIVAIIVVVLFLVGSALWWYRPKWLQRIVCNVYGARRSGEPQSCKDVLACKSPDEKGPPNLFTTLKSRAIPNQRLVDAFGIDNAFTTTDETYRKAFRAIAEAKLSSIKEEEWKRIADMALELVRNKTERVEHTNGAIPLVPFVQSMTLSISLYVLFRIEPLSLKEKTVVDIAQLINELWIASKGFYLRVFLARKKEKLQKALGKIDRTFTFTAKRTPMNLILPAYETMWRVVLHCFLEVAFRDNSTAPEWRGLLRAYLETPTSSKFTESASSQDAVSVSHIVNEALRLYPPTSRVYRRFELNRWQVAFAADIEQCQRGEEWGPDSKLFEPSRWNKIRKEDHPPFMPFNTTPFACPAKYGFGPRMVGTLVAALASRISSEDWTIGDNDESRADFGSPKMPLESGRGAFRSLELWKKPIRPPGQQVTKL